MKWVASSSDRRIWCGISGSEVGINSNAHNAGHVMIRSWRSCENVVELLNYDSVCCGYEIVYMSGCLIIKRAIWRRSWEIRVLSLSYIGRNLRVMRFRSRINSRWEMNGLI